MSTPLRLLWLDPDDRTVATGHQALTERGWVVDQACNLVEALDLISRKGYAAVILDLQLPDTLGTDAWLDIRRLQPDIVGVLTTSSESLLNLIRVDSLGLAAFVCKPLSIPAVLGLILETN